MRKIYKIERYSNGKRINPVYYENMVDLAEELTLVCFIVYVDGSESLLESIKSLCLIQNPKFFKIMEFYLYDLPSGFIVPSFPARVVSEVEVDQNGNLLSTSS